ncbi:MAG: DUF4412 domain-containing protein [Nitrospira sp. NTP1]|nr:DUF4412 domain-containing protein [Nitrospira sp. NTP1]
MQMKLTLLIGLVLSLTAVPVYAGDFEGVIQMNSSHADTGTSGTMTWYLKGDRGRMEMSRTDGQPQVMLFDGKTRTMQMGMPGQKSYMEISLEGDRGDHLKELLDTQSVERTGKTDKIAGYSCEVWRITDKEHHRAKSELCVAKGFGRAATFWIDPKEAEKKTLDASLFAFPADWAKHDMSGFQERMKAMREQKKEGGEDVSKMIEEMKKRKAARGKAGDAPGGDEQPAEMKELMKQLGEAMRKQQSQPRGGQ